MVIDYLIKQTNASDIDKCISVSTTSELARLEAHLSLRAEESQMGRNEMIRNNVFNNPNDTRFCNQSLAALYQRKAYTAGLIFSRGNFLSDTTRMICGSLADTCRDSRSVTSHVFDVHSSNLVAGANGCEVLLFPKSAMINFFDSNPGVLMSLLGTQVVI